jgi:uncharacterized membrane protein YkoI
MRFRTKLLTAAAGAVLLIGGGIGVVSATTSNDHRDTAVTQPAVQSDQTTDREQPGTDPDDTSLGGTAAERAKAAATAAVPGASVRSVERDRDDYPRAAYEVELTKPDGSAVEVELDANYKVIHIDRDQPSSDTGDRDHSATDPDDTSLGGTAAERAKAAATAAVPGASVRSIERDRDDDNPQVAYEVELTKPDGSSVEVELDASYKVIHIDRDHHADSHDRDD